MSPDYPIVLVEGHEEWSQWLTTNHDTSPGVWLATWKQGSGGRRVPAAVIAEEAIRFGWVDSRPSGYTEEQSLLLVTPRKPTSKWSKINKKRAERLIREGRMTPSGQAAVDAAKERGTWTALDEVEQLIEPPDLAEAINGTPAARA